MLQGLLNETFKMFLEMAPYLLLGVIFVAALNLFITKAFVKKQIGKKNIASIFKASLFGVPLPLCSCGVIPTTVYINDSDASKGSVTSFLISTPQTGVDSIIATYGMMGPVFAIFRPIAALFMGIFGGLFINSVVKEPAKEKKKFNLNVMSPEQARKKPFGKRLKESLNYSFVEFVDDIMGEFLIGLLIAGAIAFFLPTEFLEGTGLKSGILGMLLMIVVGAPMYICATASIPIAVSLMLKGFSPGVAFVFLAVGPATNAASFAILSKSLGKQVTMLYILAVIVLSIIFGFLLDYIYFNFGWDPLEFISMHSGHEHGGFIPYDLQIILASIFGVIALASLYRKYIRKYIRRFTDKDSSRSQMNKLKIEGMTCNHCVDTVRNSLLKVKGIEDLDISLDEGTAYYNGKPDRKKMKEAVESAGYEVKE